MSDTIRKHFLALQGLQAEQDSLIFNKPEKEALSFVVGLLEQILAGTVKVVDTNEILPKKE